MTKFSHQIDLSIAPRLGRYTDDVLHVCTTDPASHLNLTRTPDQIGLLPSEAIELRDALNRAYPIQPETFSEIKVGDTITVELTVTKVDTRSHGTMFRTDTPEWFNATDAIGFEYPPKPKIEAGQVRRFAQHGHDYRILATPEANDLVVCCRYAGTGLNSPVLLNRSEVEAAQVVS